MTISDNSDNITNNKATNGFEITQEINNATYKVTNNQTKNYDDDDDNDNNLTLGSTTFVSFVPA